ncbi:WD40/YVTN/BNR-like repeat-containing protein [Aliiglaciecola litoralis]|uniref:YCF48-related protein n=1 Tax=Aliiglaciecola litoralis TaxID=582857 RepID=A0ABN1LBS0_9ALTE
MKQISIISTLLGCTLCTLVATAEESYIAPLANESLLLDLTKTTADLVTVGERGHILRSQNGEQWVQEKAPTLSTLTAITSTEGKSWAVGHDAIIIQQDSKGQPWVIQNFLPELQKPLLDVHFINAKEGIAIGAYGTYFETSDGGENWVRVAHSQFLPVEDIEYLEEIRLEDEAFYLSELTSILPHLNKITQVGEMLYIAGESGLIARSDDKGKSWQRMDVPYYGSFFDITALEDGSVVAVGLRGNIFKLDNAGSNWVTVNSGITSSLNTIVPLEGNSFVAMGNSGNVICVKNNEVRKAHFDDGKAINALLLDENQLFIATATGIKTLAYDKKHTVCEGMSKTL